MADRAHVPFTLAGFDHVVLLIDDMSRAIDFYKNVLGCQHGDPFGNKLELKGPGVYPDGTHQKETAVS